MMKRLRFVLLVLVAVAVGGVGEWLTRPSASPIPSVALMKRVFAINPDGAAHRLLQAGIAREPQRAGAQQHFHVALRLWVDGALQVPPRGVGLVDAGRPAAIHTHDFSGVVHIHHPVGARPYTLADVMTVWGVRYDRDHLGPWPLRAGWRARLWVNRRQVGFGAPVALHEHQDIVLAMASPGVALPSHPPLEPFDWESAPIRRG